MQALLFLQPFLLPLDKPVLLIAPEGQQGADNATDEVKWIYDALGFCQHFLLLCLCLQRHLFFVFIDLQHLALSTTEHLDGFDIPIQGF